MDTTTTTTTSSTSNKYSNNSGSAGHRPPPPTTIPIRYEFPPPPPSSCSDSKQPAHSECEEGQSSFFRELLREMCSLFRREPQMNGLQYDQSLNTKPSSFDRSVRPNKRALLCGVTYSHKRKFMLKGTVNDVKDMRDLLINQYHYLPQNIRVLTESEKEKEYQPTKKNIEYWLKWLVKECQRGDSLVFYFSGHGLRQPDFKDDEIDGFDETICPVDFMEEGMIFDNDINTMIVRPLPTDVKLHAIVDACHSGTILDLQYVYDIKQRRWDDHSPPSGALKCTNGGWAVCLSACEDHQLAADTTAFTGKTMNGATTYVLIDILKKSHNKNITYGELLDSLSDVFERSAADQVKCFNSRRIARLFGNKINQKPLLSSSKRFDIYKTTFSL